jgi:hypothetical protein
MEEPPASLAAPIRGLVDEFAHKITTPTMLCKDAM